MVSRNIIAIPDSGAELMKSVYKQARPLTYIPYQPHSHPALLKWPTAPPSDTSYASASSCAWMLVVFELWGRWAGWVWGKLNSIYLTSKSSPS